MLERSVRIRIITLLAIALVIAACTASQAKPGGWSIKYWWDNNCPCWIITIDWHNVDLIDIPIAGFQCYVQSDPTKVELESTGMQILAPFVGPTPPPNPDLGGGLFRVTGAALAGTPLSLGEVDIAEFHFTDLHYTGEVPLFTVFSGPDGYALLGDGTTLGPDDMYPASTVPEPGGAVALLTGAMGLAGFGIRRRMTS